MADLAALGLSAMACVELVHRPFRATVRAEGDFALGVNELAGKFGAKPVRGFLSAAWSRLPRLTPPRIRPLPPPLVGSRVVDDHDWQYRLATTEGTAELEIAMTGGKVTYVTAELGTQTLPADETPEGAWWAVIDQRIAEMFRPNLLVSQLMERTGRGDHPPGSSRHRAHRPAPPLSRQSLLPLGAPRGHPLPVHRRPGNSAPVPTSTSERWPITR
ncbi:hypothetical protein [Carbonactinospora thermoautotrophica]|uniref:hypothetical protein n=1 Tax=Carbonactinospora thermoautotrophica TaxID=1469144 RepID=UPI003DA9BA9F